MENPVEFQLFETIRWEQGKGFFLLPQHLARLKASAEYFAFYLPGNEVITASLERALADADYPIIRTHLNLSQDGAIHISTQPFLPTESAGPVLLSLAPEPVRSDSVLLYHKTTNRSCYIKAQQGCASHHEAILWNEQGEITETPIANIVVRKKGELVTPPVKCGLLPGTFRDFLLKQGSISEEVVTLEDLHQADSIYLINSLRGWRKGALAPSQSQPQVAV
jgi:para-aminobenzoate synthetase/4-amino-4-deoxychorismate lyase